MSGNSFDPNAYDDDQSFVYEYGADLLELLDPSPGDRILDLGCGNGHLTAEVVTAADVVGVDADRAMLAEARDSHPSLPVVRGDARSLAVDGPFDGVLSNAVLHWVPAEDQDAVIEEIARVLRPGGRFVAELGGAGNVATIVDATLSELRERGHEATTPWYFPPVGEYAVRLEQGGFEVRRAKLFDRPTPLEGRNGLRSWLEQFGDRLFAGLSAAERESVVDATEERLRPTAYDPDERVWTADYRRLRFVAVREG
jgi:trans-aconitate methyltransferase